MKTREQWRTTGETLPLLSRISTTDVRKLNDSGQNRYKMAASALAFYSLVCGVVCFSKGGFFPPSFGGGENERSIPAIPNSVPSLLKTEGSELVL